MSPSRKTAGLRGPRRSHVPRRQGPAAPLSDPLDPPPPAEVIRMPMLTCRELSNGEACSGFADWVHGLAGMVAEHAIPPVFRVGAITWLARVALRPQGGAA
jgi:esterase/lipase superfamily enzyme